MTNYIPCMECAQRFTRDWNWYICDECGFRVCQSCFPRQTGPYNNSGGFKCGQCQYGHLEQEDD